MNARFFRCEEAAAAAGGTMQQPALSPLSGGRALQLQLQQRRATLAALGGTDDMDDGLSTAPASRRGSRGKAALNLLLY